MKIFLSLFVVLVSTSLFADQNAPSVSATSDEIQRLDLCIEATKRLLEVQTNLKSKLLEFRSIEQKCIQNPKDAPLMQKLVVTANETKKLIDEANLDEYFHADFLHELSQLSQLADRKNIPPA